MNEYIFETLQIGQTENFSVTITEKMMEQFCKISGDVNPLHCDKAYAKSQGYPDRVVYGLLTSSLYSTLAGVYLPGKYSLLHEVQIKFRKPVFPNDEMTVVGEISAKHELFRQITVSAEIRNQNGEKVSKALLKIGVGK